MLPSKKVKIGNFVYTIYTTDYVKLSFFGETSPEDKEICIATKRAPGAIQDTILHEFIHALAEDIFEAILPTLSEEEAGKVEEAFVRLFNPRLLQFIKDNPKWIAYLQKKHC